MFANYLIGLREGLEAALVISILLAYLVRTGRRDMLRSLWTGVAIAIFISLVAGAVLTFGPSTLTFETREAIGGTLSIFAVGLITWMIFWMARTARHMRAELQNRLDDAMAAGPRAVALLALLAVGREGLETALFLWAGARASGTVVEPIVGAVLGLATAIAIGWLFYRGAVRINLRMFFQWTGLFLIIVAGGILAYGIHDLQEANLLPGLNDLAFDLSAVIPPSGILGTILKGIFNFSVATTWLEAIAWVGYVVPTAWFFVRTVRGPSSTVGPSAATPQGEPKGAPKTAANPSA